MLLSELMKILDKRTCFDLVGYDDDNGKSFVVFRGYPWQLIIGGHIEDCEVISICQLWSDSNIRILANISYDEEHYRHGGFKVWH